MSGKPISVDAAGNGLYALPGGGFAFVDFESPEERYCRSFGDEFDPGELEREQYELGLIREDYSDYFRVFHNQFLFSYSQQCSASVVNPVTFNVTPIEETVYGDGSSSGPRQAGDTYQLTLDRKFENTYIRYENANKLWLTSRVLSAELDLRSGRGGGAGVSRVVGWVLKDKADIDDFIRQGCSAERVQTVYQSLDRVL